jgi:hypothetical protein
VLIQVGFPLYAIPENDTLLFQTDSIVSYFNQIANKASRFVPKVLSVMPFINTSYRPAILPVTAFFNKLEFGFLKVRYAVLQRI